MMKITDLPVFRSRIRKFFLEPRQFLGIQVIGIENEEMDIAFLEGIVLLPIHVKEFIETLIRIVMVTQSRVKLHACIQQRLIRDLELLLQLGRTPTSDNVVAQHDRKSERKLLVKLLHALRDLVLGGFSCPHIPNGREADRAGLDGQSDILCPQRQGLPAQEYNE